MALYCLVKITVLLNRSCVLMSRELRSLLQTVLCVCVWQGRVGAPGFPGYPGPPGLKASCVLGFCGNVFSLEVIRKEDTISNCCL